MQISINLTPRCSFQETTSIAQSSSGRCCSNADAFQNVKKVTPFFRGTSGPKLSCQPVSRADADLTVVLSLLLE